MKAQKGMLQLGAINANVAKNIKLIGRNKMPIIDSLLDLDLYKFSMQMAVLYKFSDVQMEYEYKCRNKKVKWTIEMIKDLEEEIEHLYTLTFKEDELEYLSTLNFLKSDYIDFLRLFKLQKRYINISYAEDNELILNINGPWRYVILFETLLLSIINEVYFKYYGTDDIEIGRKLLKDKINKLKDGLTSYPFDDAPGYPQFDNNFKLIDFGARRRYSRKWHEEVVATLVKELPNIFVGSSDVLMAKNNKIKPIGTMAHEWIMAGQGLVRIKDSQKYMFQQWAEVYRGNLGIALSDTYGVDAFIRDFDMYFCKLFDGCRQDSGDPFVWTDKIIKMYKGYNIDPKTKIAVYSDGLDIDKAIAIYKYVNGRMKTTFGIGTNLTNDFGIEPLNIVIKAVRVNGQPVAKLSDSEGKVMCKDEAYLIYLKSQFGIK